MLRLISLAGLFRALILVAALTVISPLTASAVTYDFTQLATGLHTTWPFPNVPGFEFSQFNVYPCTTFNNGVPCSGNAADSFGLGIDYNVNTVNSVTARFFCGQTFGCGNFKLAIGYFDGSSDVWNNPAPNSGYFEVTLNANPSKQVDRAFFVGSQGLIASLSISYTPVGYHAPVITLGNDFSTSNPAVSVSATRTDSGTPPIVSYAWSLTKPAGSNVTVPASTTASSLSRTLDVPGAYTFSVTANDGIGNSNTAFQTITFTSPTAPPTLPPLASGIQDGSGNGINSKCPTCNPKPAVDSVTNPVNVANGALWHETTDFSIPGQTPDTALSFTRTYVAMTATSAGDLGSNWRHNFETSLYTSGSNIIWVDEAGAPWTFTAQGSTFAVPTGITASFAKFSDHFELKKKNGTIYVFSILGKLQSITNAHGVALTMTYDGNGKLASVTSPLAGAMSFTRNAAGQIATVTRVRDNLIYTYLYDSSGHLTTVTDFAANSYQYTYVSRRKNKSAQGLLASITDPLNRTLSFSYYSNGKIYRQIEAGGGTRSFLYGNQETILTDVDGLTYRYFFDANFHTIQEMLPDGTCIYNTWTNGRLMATRVENSGNTLFDYDANGNIKSIQRPEDSGPVLITYDQTFNKPILIQPIVGAPTQFTLNSTNGDVTQVARNGMSLAFTRDTFGNILSITNGRGTYTNQRDPNTGLLTQVFDLHNTETRTYDLRNRLSTRSFASGRILTYTLDNFDRVVNIADNNGPSVASTFDAMGRLIQRTVSAGSVSQTTSFQFDSHDRLTQITDPLNRITTFTYAADRIIDKPISITDPAGRNTYFVYDKRHRLVQKTDAMGAVTQYAYDSRSNLVSVTDANGNLTSYSFDGNDRKIGETRPSVAGNSSAVRTQTFSYDGADHLLREVTLSVATGGANRAIVNSYDLFDRLVERKVQREGTSTTIDDDSTFAYENQLDANLLNGAINGVASLSFTNESAPPFAETGFAVAAAQSGNPLGLITGTFGITRDVTGEIASVSKDVTPLYSKQYDFAGRLKVVTTPGGFSSAIGYDGLGRKQSVVHSDGSSGSFSSDLLNRITSVSWTGPTPISENLSFDLAGNVTTLGREGGSSSTIASDAVDQIVTSSGTYNKNIGYDLVGNRISGSDGPGNVVSNFLISNGTTAFLADADGFGDTIKETSGAIVKNYAYRADDLLNSVQTGTTQSAYYFDALGRRVAKIINQGAQSINQSYVYLGQENRILMGQSVDGIPTTYIDGQGVDEHLAEVKGGVGKGYVTDHLSSVLNGDAAGASHAFGLFGETTPVSISPSSSPVMYGFAGREFDPESSLSYNRARSFSPNEGRFLSQDRLGYRARDPNFYRYVKNRPQVRRDPFGFDDMGFDYGFTPWPDSQSVIIQSEIGGAATAGGTVVVGMTVVAGTAILGGAAAATCPAIVVSSAKALADACAKNLTTCTAAIEAAGQEAVQLATGESTPSEMTGTPADVILTMGQLLQNMKNAYGD